MRLPELNDDEIKKGCKLLDLGGIFWAIQRELPEVSISASHLPNKTVPYLVVHTNMLIFCKYYTTPSVNAAIVFTNRYTRNITYTDLKIISIVSRFIT